MSPTDHSSLVSPSVTRTAVINGRVNHLLVGKMTPFTHLVLLSAKLHVSNMFHSRGRFPVTREGKPPARKHGHAPFHVTFADVGLPKPVSQRLLL